MSDNLLKLTPDELDRYAPYHTWSEFTMGHDDYMLGVTTGHWVDRSDPNSVGGQAYDRGAEFAMRRWQAQFWKKRGLPPGYQDNGDGTFSMDW